jgi:uncharacterized protein (TIGR02598 family)
MNAVSTLPRQLRTAPQGFSLIEVSLAMAIVAVVLIPLLALLPHGMSSVRDAKSTMIMSRVANEIVGELQQADWGTYPSFPNLMQYDGQTREYDAEGTPLGNGETRRPDQITSFKAYIDIANELTLMPGQSAARNEGRFLRQVSIKVAFAPNDRAVDFSAAPGPSTYKIYVTEVANMAEIPLPRKSSS